MSNLSPAEKDLFPDISCDIETTGTHPGSTAIIQIAAVRFNLKERTVSPDFFNRCLLIPADRYWEQSTMDWWAKNPAVLKSIYARMEDPATVLKDFHAWCGGSRNLFAKPTHFEFPQLENYFRKYGVGLPFHFRMANDQNSFLRGLHYPNDPPNWEKDIPFVGNPHDALDDALHQVKVVLTATKDVIAKRTVEVQNDHISV